MSRDHVRPTISKLTDEDARHLLAEGLIRVCHEKGPSRVALEIGCDEKTVRRARNEESTLGLASVVNLALVEPEGVRPLFEAIGKRLVDIDGEKTADLSIPCIFTRFMWELSVALEDGKLDPAELRRMRPKLEEVGAAVDELRARMAPTVVRG